MHTARRPVLNAWVGCQRPYSSAARPGQGGSSITTGTWPVLDASAQAASCCQKVWAGGGWLFSSRL